MKSPQDMRIIQIDVTNACIHQCSNCTRFCGHHKKPFFMDVETFKKAVDSMEGYVGTVSMMGIVSIMYISSPNAILRKSAEMPVPTTANTIRGIRVMPVATLFSKLRSLIIFSRVIIFLVTFSISKHRLLFFGFRILF